MTDKNAELPAIPGQDLLGFQGQLMALADASPQDFQGAAAKVAQAALALGMATIEPPRTIKELATWLDIWRKLSGLDQKQAVASAVLFAPMRSLKRRAGGLDLEVLGEG